MKFIIVVNVFASGRVVQGSSSSVTTIKQSEKNMKAVTS